MLPKDIFKQYIRKHTDLKSRDLKEYEKRAKKMQRDLELFLIEEGVVDEVGMYTEAAKLLDVPFVTIRGREIDKDTLNLVPPTIAQTHNIVSYGKTAKEVQLAMLDPLDIQTAEFIGRKIGLRPVAHLTTPTDMKDALRRYHADLEQDINIVELKDGTEAEEGDLKKAAEELPIVNIVNSMLEHAVYENASDIHIEPTEKEVIVRYRVDGVLKGVMTLPKKVQDGIVARIKILTNLKIDEHRLPQDGRFKIKIDDEKLSFRVSILPVYDGEKIVMRMLHEGQKPLSLDELGFLPGPKKLLEAAIKKPHGMVLVTGPTGSGKTTTLYSVLGMLNSPGVNISTIEDPIEYHVKGINQSQINSRVGYTFASGLRAFLRQDPDIIMVGEIRDKETAEIAIHAAMTGHLVLSTLHTNDAPTTLPRLMDMDIPPFLLAFTANVIVAQRLVRKLCEHCRSTTKLPGEAAKEVEKLVSKKRAMQLLRENKVKTTGKEKSLASMTFYRGKGCRRCGDSGYKGRIGIYEIMDINEQIEKKINSRANADELRTVAIAQGMVSMVEDGFVKAKQGITTIEEVLRVTRE